MPNDTKEESKFGFKDKAKAEETLHLLEEHDMQYRKLTVRGLLGRAKRVLTLTKAEEKINNIKSAIEIFELWLVENGVDTTKKTAKKPTEGAAEEKKPETVPGLGFKDKDRALETLQVLAGRDPDYQKLAIKGLIGSAKRVLPGTKDKDKINNINAALDVFNKFLDDFDSKNMSKQTLAYLPYSTVKSFLPLAEKYEVLKNALVAQFLEAYEKVENYKHLRTIKQPDTEITWDIVRNKELRKLTETFEAEYPNLFEDNKDPSDIHIKMIMWGYSPNSARIKTLATQLSGSDEDKRGTKRKSGGGDSDAESPRKK